MKPIVNEYMTKALGLVAGSALLFGGYAANAQILEEVVVTAQKREQNLQDVPISVTAFSGEQLTALGINDFVEITDQSLGLTTARWSFDLHSDEFNEGLGAEYRARYLRLRSSAQRETLPGSDGWLTHGELAFRLGADFELIFGALEDNRKGPLSAGLEQPISSTSIGGRWQRGSRFELFAKFTDSTLQTLGGGRLEGETYSLDSVFLAGALRLETGLEYRDLTGRFPRQEGALRIRADYRFGSRTLVHLAAHKRDDPWESEDRSHAVGIPQLSSLFSTRVPKLTLRKLIRCHELPRSDDFSSLPLAPA